jgi:ribonuclease J
MGLIRQYLKQKVARSFAGKNIDLDAIKKELKEEITHILYDQTRRTPIVIPVINEIGSGSNMPNQTRGNNQNSNIESTQKAKQSTPINYPKPQVPDSDANEPKLRFDHRSY